MILVTKERKKFWRQTGNEFVVNVKLNYVIDVHQIF